MKEGLDKQMSMQALRRLGEVLSKDEPDLQHIQLIIVGGVAGLLTDQLPEEMMTIDCDVMEVIPDQDWERIEAAARIVAAELGLDEKWLNRECRHFAWYMPLGWKDRSEPVGEFGPILVRAISRFDQLAAKLMAGAKRARDRRIFARMKPSVEEIERLRKFLDRLASENLDRNTFDIQREILDEVEKR